MIGQSYLYKEEIEKITRRMNNRISMKRWSERSIFLVEKDFYIFSTLVRKLLDEPCKITEKVKRHDIRVNKYPATGHPPLFFNNTQIGKLYNLRSGEKVKININAICNQGIHSYIFMPVWCDTTLHLKSFLLNSNATRSKALYEFSLDDFFLISKLICEDEVLSINCKQYIGKKGKVFYKTEAN